MLQIKSNGLWGQAISKGLQLTKDGAINKNDYTGAPGGSVAGHLSSVQVMIPGC